MVAMAAARLDPRPAATAGEPGDRARAHAVLRAHGDHPSIALAFHRDMRYETAPGLDAVIPYRPAGRFLLAFGGVFGAEPDRRPLLERFVEAAERTGRRVCAVQVRDAAADLFHRAGFRLNQLGCSYTLRLDGFRLAGGSFMQLRNKIRRAEATGIRAVEVGADVAAPPDLRQALDGVTRAWVRAKGRHQKVLEFLVGDLDALARPGTRCFVALRDSALLAFITYVPVWGSRPGLLHDLSRRRPDCPPGVMELVNSTAIRRFQAEGVGHLHFGFTPFAEVGRELGSHSPLVAALVRALARWGGAVYPAASQVAYKRKWGPQIVEPEYLAFRGRFRLGAVWQLLRITRSI
ncbi:MAG TPA: DUF2156 domain-containing protein [Methylomirabilota bacterium]|nr:DUF2156 domain-containing protein [Methylomirabilota bacterium]